jgi:nucleotide-binding universal stress UspA family protein
VLDAARAKGCDLLIKGAFTRNRLGQMIFGGATSYIMEHARFAGPHGTSDGPDIC